MTRVTHDPMIERSKVEVSKPINAETQYAPYLPSGRPTNFKLGTGMEYEYLHHRHAGGGRSAAPL